MISTNKARPNTVCMYESSLFWAEFVWADFAMGRVCDGASLLWAEMSSF